MSTKNGKTNGHKNGNGKKPEENLESLKVELFWRFLLGEAKGNGTEAARMAGFKGDDNVLAVQAYRLIRTKEVQDRIRARLEDALSLTPNEVIGVLASHLRADVTEILTEGGHLDVAMLRERKLGHLIRKIKTRRYVERTGDDEKGEPVEVTEVELHDAFKAAVQLSRIMGIEKQPATNPADEQARIDAAVKQFMERTGADEEQARLYLAPHIPEVKNLGTIG